MFKVPKFTIDTVRDVANAIGKSVNMLIMGALGAEPMIRLLF